MIALLFCDRKDEKSPPKWKSRVFKEQLLNSSLYQCLHCLVSWPLKEFALNTVQILGREVFHWYCLFDRLAPYRICFSNFFWFVLLRIGQKAQGRVGRSSQRLAHQFLRPVFGMGRQIFNYPWGLGILFYDRNTHVSFIILSYYTYGMVGHSQYRQ